MLLGLPVAGTEESIDGHTSCPALQGLLEVPVIASVSQGADHRCAGQKEVTWLVTPAGRSVFTAATQEGFQVSPFRAQNKKHSSPSVKSSALGWWFSG